jgi:hypothetical protein
VLACWSPDFTIHHIPYIHRVFIDLTIREGDCPQSPRKVVRTRITVVLRGSRGAGRRAATHPADGDIRVPGLSALVLWEGLFSIAVQGRCGLELRAVSLGLRGAGGPAATHSADGDIRVPGI